MRKSFVTGLWICAAMAVTGLTAACDATDNPLAPYDGARPLIIQKLTQSYAPDVQWVGGRVAAVGINRGDRAALDSTLVWMVEVQADDLGSPVYVREALDEEAVTKAGGTPTDSLHDGETYTLWLAEREALDAALQGAALDAHGFADTTFTLRYLLTGRSAGGVDADFAIFRDERLTSDRYRVTWTPASQAFRRIAIRNSTVGGFSDLLWHVVLPDSVPDNMTPPITIGDAPEGSIVATEWDGFATGNHVLWAATNAWDGESFGFRADGYAFFQIFASNFD